MSTVLVLGCGPSGLLAAHAAQLAGHEVDVVSDKKKSRLGGAQYLHHPIPELTPSEPQGRLSVLSMGTKEGYAKKVYGSSQAEVSWDLYVGEEPIDIWDMVDMYDVLWDRWESSISQDVITEPTDVLQLLDVYDKVISTIPAPALCWKKEEHSFLRQDIYIIPRFPYTDSGKDVIIYNGNPADPWYRASSIFGRGMIEYSAWSWGIPNNEKNGMWVKKPLKTNCDCFEGSVIKVGRYGKWHKGDLVTDVFDEVYDVLTTGKISQYMERK